MKTILNFSLTIMVLLCPLIATGQSLPMTRTVMGVEAKVWKAPSAPTGLPVSVDNSTSRHFPPIFNQRGGSCAQASSIGYMFTYEMNSLLDRDASTPENRFSYMYTWNLVNDGKDEGSFQFDGLQMSTSNGIMTEADFPVNFPLYQFKWASGFEKYLNAMHYKGDNFINLEITDTTSLLEVKQYLYNKGEAGRKGGVLTFSSQATGWKFNTSYSGPSETGYNCVLTKLAYDGAHAMTIVGYDDLIEFTRPDGKVSKGAFIVVNSYGEDYWNHDRGRYYLPYWFFLSEHTSVELNNGLMGIIPEYVDHPDVVFKVALDYTSRNDLSFRFGFSDNNTDENPKHNYKFSIFNHQGGEHEMQGMGVGSFFEFGMDFSQYSDRLEGIEEPNWFLTVIRSPRGAKIGEGFMKAFEVYDFREDPKNPKIYVHKNIDGVKLVTGENIFNIPAVEPDSCSFSPIEWLNKSGQPIAAPFVFKTADGKYAKVRFSEYDRESGSIRIKYVYAPDGRKNLE